MTKTDKLTVRIHNTETNEVIDRDMTEQEIADFKANQIAYAAKMAEIEARSIAKSALLEKLGITEDEAKLLLS